MILFKRKVVTPIKKRSEKEKVLFRAKYFSALSSHRFHRNSKLAVARVANICCSKELVRLMRMAKKEIDGRRFVGA